MIAILMALSIATAVPPHDTAGLVPGGPSTGSVAGILWRADGPWPYAAVRLAGTKLGGQTDEHGRFLIRTVPTGRQVIEIPIIGYPLITASLEVRAGKTTFVSMLSTYHFARAWVDSVPRVWKPSRRSRRPPPPLTPVVDSLRTANEAELARFRERADSLCVRLKAAGPARVYRLDPQSDSAKLARSADRFGFLAVIAEARRPGADWTRRLRRQVRKLEMPEGKKLCVVEFRHAARWIANGDTTELVVCVSCGVGGFSGNHRRLLPVDTGVTADAIRELFDRAFRHGEVALAH